MWSNRFWRFAMYFSNPLSRRLTISRRNTPDLQPGSRKVLFLSLQRSPRSTSRIWFTSCGGVKTSSLLRFAMQLRTSGLKLISDTGDLHVMDRGIFPYRSGDKHMLTKVGEERELLLAVQTREQRGLHGSLMPKQFAECKIPPFEHAPVDRRPLWKDDVAGLLTYCIERQSIAPNDVPPKDEPYRLPARFLASSFEQARVVCFEYFEESASANANVVGENIDPIDRGDG